MVDENSADDGGVDLFGNPLAPIRDRRGRPSFKKDKENQDFVMVRAANGWTHRMIAEDMGIDEKTLRKHFSRELEIGLVRVKGVILDVLLRKVREGHIPSARLLMETFEDAAPAAPRAHAVADDDGKAEPLGKKEQRLQDAQVVPPDYGDIFDRVDRARRSQH